MYILIDKITSKNKRKKCYCIFSDASSNEIIVESENVKNQGSQTIHAEMLCTKYLIDTNDVNREINIFLTKSPCGKCGMVLYYLKIKNIYYIDYYEYDMRNYIISYFNFYTIDKTTITLDNNINIQINKQYRDLIIRDDTIVISITYKDHENIYSQSFNTNNVIQTM